MFPYSTGRQIWRIVYPVLIFLAIPNLVAVTVFFYDVMRSALTQGYLPDVAQLNEMLEVWAVQNTLPLTMVGQLLCLAPFIPIYVNMRRNALRFHRVAPRAALASLAASTFFGLSLIVGLLLSLINVDESYEFLESALSSGSVIIRFITLAIVAPVVEELCFRGIVLGRSLSWVNPMPAIMLQAALFGVVHMNLLQGLYAFALGILLGMIFVRFRNLWLCMVGHFAFNLPSVLIGIIEEGGTEISVFWILIPGVIMALAGLVLCRMPAATLSLGNRDVVHG